MKELTKEHLLRSGLDVQHLYTDISLGGVVTMQEAAYLWNKSIDQVRWACKMKKLHFRKSLSGGTILISVWSLAELWSIPQELTLWDCFIGNIDIDSTEAYTLVAMKGNTRNHGV